VHLGCRPEWGLALPAVGFIIGRRPAPSYRWIDTRALTPILGQAAAARLSKEAGKLVGDCVARTADRALHFKCKRRMVFALEVQQHGCPDAMRFFAESSEIPRVARLRARARVLHRKGPNPCHEESSRARL